MCRNAFIDRKLQNHYCSISQRDHTLFLAKFQSQDNFSALCSFSHSQSDRDKYCCALMPPFLFYGKNKNKTGVLRKRMKTAGLTLPEVKKSKGR